MRVGLVARLLSHSIAFQQQSTEAETDLEKREMLRDQLKCLSTELQDIQVQITSAQQSIVELDSVDMVGFFAALSIMPPMNCSVFRDPRELLQSTRTLTPLWTRWTTSWTRSTSFSTSWRWSSIRDSLLIVGTSITRLVAWLATTRSVLLFSPFSLMQLTSARFIGAHRCPAS